MTSPSWSSVSTDHHPIGTPPGSGGRGIQVGDSLEEFDAVKRESNRPAS